MTAPLAGLAPPLFAGIETGAEYMVKVEIDWDAEHETVRVWHAVHAS